MSRYGQPRFRFQRAGAIAQTADIKVLKLEKSTNPRDSRYFFGFGQILKMSFPEDASTGLSRGKTEGSPPQGNHVTCSKRCFGMARMLTGPANAIGMLSGPVLSGPAMFQDRLHRSQRLRTDMMLYPLAVDGRGLRADSHRFQERFDDFVPST